MHNMKANLAVASAFTLVFLLNYLDGYIKADLYRLYPLYFWVFDFTKFVLVPGLCLAALATWSGVKPRHYGLGWPALTKTEFLTIAVLVTFTMQVVYYYASYLSWRILAGATPPQFNYSETIPPGLAGKLVAVYFAATAALVEEIYYRGLTWRLLEGSFSPGVRKIVYTLGAASFFAAIHWENGSPELIATFAYGVAACLWYLRLRNLWPLVLAHFVIDLWFYW